MVVNSNLDLNSTAKGGSLLKLSTSTTNSGTSAEAVVGDAVAAGRSAALKPLTLVWSLGFREPVRVSQFVTQSWEQKLQNCGLQGLSASAGFGFSG